MNSILGIQISTNPKISKENLVVFLPQPYVTKAQSKGNEGDEL